MPRRIILLCAAADGRHLATALSLHNPQLAVTVTETAVDLAAAVATADGATRLVAFLTGVVVPQEILERLSGPAYNFHPAPPEYPGKHPVAFALYDGAAHYGATAHEMTLPTDSGAIVGTLRFAVPAGATPAWLKEQAYAAAIRLFSILAGPLATQDAPLPRTALTWGDRRCSQRAYDRLRELPPDIDPDEMARRLAAIDVKSGDAPPFVTLHGRRFILNGP